MRVLRSIYVWGVRSEAPDCEKWGWGGGEAPRIKITQYDLIAHDPMLHDPIAAIILLRLFVVDPFSLVRLFNEEYKITSCSLRK